MTDDNCEYDIAIIGGGINGCGIARDAAGRGLKVLLIEKSDLASGTSSSSTKLIHGGLRYLEHYKFRLVREALLEREVLFENAPHIIRPLRFLLPHHTQHRSTWLIRIGLFLYDHLGGRRHLPATSNCAFDTPPYRGILQPQFVTGFEYSDCWVDDARLVVLNAMDAQQHGADIRTQTTLHSAIRDKHWHLTLQNQQSQTRCEVRARVLINAAGPWADHVLETLEKRTQDNIRLVRGSHIIVPRLFTHDRAYIFQHTDQRVIFAIPYQEQFTLIGTTDEDHDTSLDDIRISGDEIHYLCNAVNHYFKQSISADDVIGHYAGVRPLYNDGASAAQEATRDYIIKLDHPQGHAPLLNIFGGKITTYRRLAEAALAQLNEYLPRHTGPWTKHAPLPGGDFKASDIDVLAQQLCEDYAFIELSWSHQLIRRYGTQCWTLLANARTIDDLGYHFGASLYEREVDYLVKSEWATTADDILWRRTKLGLQLNAAEQDSLQKWLNDRAKTASP